MFWDAIIEAGDPRWDETLRRFSGYDFYHLSGYVALEAERRNARASAFVFNSDQGAFMVPFMSTPVPLTLQPMGASAWDALAPYGYAGPLVTVEGDEQQRAKFTACALARMIEHLRCRNICSILLRLHPLLLPPLQPFQAAGKLIEHGETVCLDLRQSPEQLLADMRQGFRYPIKRLERDGYRFELDFEGKHMQEFSRLYHETMLRVRAEPQYFFSEQYLRGIKQALGRGFMLAHVRNPAGDIVSSGIFTVCSGIVQYHLSGNSLGGKGSDASKLLLHGVSVWAHEQGLEKFHLGGGSGPKTTRCSSLRAGFPRAGPCSTPGG